MTPLVVRYYGTRRCVCIAHADGGRRTAGAPPDPLHIRGHETDRDGHEADRAPDHGKRHREGRVLLRPCIRSPAGSISHSCLMFLLSLLECCSEVRPRFLLACLLVLTIGLVRLLSFVNLNLGLSRRRGFVSRKARLRLN